MTSRTEALTPAAAADTDRTAQQIARNSRSSFTVSFAFLDKDRRRALTSVYAFCRVVDDAVDDPANPADPEGELACWENELARAEDGDPETDVGREVQRAMRRFGVQRRHLQNVIDGVRMDLDSPRFEDFAELESYCFKVASSVGLACLPIFGARGAEAERYALHLGQALQHTNILRDLRGDAREGRVYVPRALLEELEIDPEWLRGEADAGHYSLVGPMAALTGALAARAHAHFERANACLDADMRRKVLPAEIMGAVYREVLRRLERLGGAVCTTRRVRLPKLRKLMIALAVRRRIRRGR